ncbi:MAG TPA: RebB family R body protein [Rhizomicrobium sp.]|jgi:hypothetical protein|nr:RebB family R body protein [Rhizomicrobium sp.]
MSDHDDHPLSTPVKDVVDASGTLTGAAWGEAAMTPMLVHAASLAMLNAVAAQQNAYITANAVVTATVSRILGTQNGRVRNG